MGPDPKTFTILAKLRAQNVHVTLKSFESCSSGKFCHWQNRHYMYFEKGSVNSGEAHLISRALRYTVQCAKSI